MKQIILIFIAFGLATTSYSQYDFLLEKQSLGLVRVYEDSIESKSIGFVKTQVGENYFPTAKEKYDYFPLCFIRTNDSFYPELHIEYFYDEIDSTLLATSYDWNIMDYVKNLKTDGDKLDKEKKRKKEYLNKYKSIKQYLVKEFGSPTSVEEKKSKDGYFYRLRWDNESTEILVLLKFSTKLKVLPGNMKIGSFNIRVKVNYMK